MVGAYVDTPRDDRPGGDTPRNGLPRGTTARTARMAALPLAFGGRAVAGWGRRLAGADADTVSAAMMERNAEQLFAVLGQLRGGAMKVGQALAVYESMMPAELAEPYRRALVRLQAQGPPRRASGRCTGRGPRRGGPSRSRSSTRAPTRRWRRTCGCSSGSPGCSH